MLTFYLILAISGGFFVVMSAFAGGHDSDGDLDSHDFDGGGDADDIDGEGDVEVDSGIDPHHDIDGDAQVLWIPFFSFKFWTFFAAFTGVTGVVFTLLKFPRLVTLVVALLVGFSVGYIASYLLHRLRKEKVSSLVVTDDIVGNTGEVIVPFKKNEIGLVRIEVGEKLLEFPAISNKVFKKGDRVVVLKIVDNKLFVDSEEILYKK